MLFAAVLYFRDKTYRDQPGYLSAVMAVLRFLSVSNQLRSFADDAEQIVTMDGADDRKYNFGMGFYNLLKGITDHHINDNQ